MPTLGQWNDKHTFGLRKDLKAEGGWVCSGCGTSNEKSMQACGKCGASPKSMKAGGPGSGRRPYGGANRFEGPSNKQHVLKEAMKNGGKLSTSQSDGAFHQRALQLGKSGHLSLESKEKGDLPRDLPTYNWKITAKGRTDHASFKSDQKRGFIDLGDED